MLGDDELPSERARRGRRKPLVMGGALCVFGALYDIIAGRVLINVGGLMLAMGLFTLGMASLSPAAANRSYTRWLTLMVAGCTGCFVLMVLLTGGPASRMLMWVGVVPLGMAVLLQDEVIPVSTAALLIWLGTTVGLWGNMEGGSLAPLSLGLLSASMLAVYGSAVYRRRRLSEIADERAKNAALSALAIAQHRQAQAERMALVGRLAAGVAHEVNNPLVYVMSNVEYLRTSLVNGEAGNPEETRKLLQETWDGLERIAHIVLDLKTFAREDTQALESCNLHELTADAMRLAAMRFSKDTQLVVDVPADLPPVRVNRRKLTQALLNLLVNACDALEEGKVAAAAVRLAAWREAEAMVLVVEDNGPGVEAKVLKRLFEPFFTTKPPGKGTGLGLSLSREYVESFGGTLTAENRPEGGARFVIRLRVMAKPDGTDRAGAPQ
jgi:signal transduction histidine kinase